MAPVRSSVARMKLVRLKKIRLVEQHAAERELIGAAAAATAAARRLAAVEQQEICMRNEMVRALADGDSESAYLRSIEQALVCSARPRIEQDKADKERVRDAVATAYLTAVREYSVVEEIVDAERNRARASAEDEEQKTLDNAHRVRWYRNQSSAVRRAGDGTRRAGAEDDFPDRTQVRRRSPESPEENLSMTSD
jgi:hypothetical protein